MFSALSIGYDRLSRELILQQVWGWKRDVGSRTVDVHVRWLRRKIEPDPADPRRIVTVRGVGYRFDGERRLITSGRESLTNR